MKQYKTSGRETCFLREITVEAESESDAEEAFREKWMNGEIDVCDSDLAVTVEEVDDG